MIDRKAFIAGLAAALWSVRPAQAQPAGKPARIGFLAFTDGPMPLEQSRMEALRGALRQLGWVEGTNIVIETAYAGPNPQRQRDMAGELKAKPVALIFASGTPAIRSARAGAPGVPIVMINAGDPVGSGFVASLARPGGDLTGTSAAGEEILAKQLELLSIAGPQLKRISVLMNSSNPANDFFFNALTSRAQLLGLQLQRIDVSQAAELEQAIASAKGGGLLVMGDPMFGLNRLRIVELSLQHKLPSIFGPRLFVEIGGLMSYLSADLWHWRSAAGFIDKILKGAKPAELPVQQPTQFELTINLKTAKTLGLSIPQSLLLRADEVIQ